MVIILGSDCEINFDECSSGPCLNNATCNDEVNGYKCGCLPGFVGVHCEVDINECASDPCRGNHACLDKVEN